MSALQQDFDRLEHDLEQLIALLDEAGETFWARTLARGLPRLRARELAGATYVLGCFGGEDTLSDLRIQASDALCDPLQLRNLNARLGALRTATFQSAEAIAARRNW